MKFTVEYEQEDDGRWLAEVKELPGVMVYGKDPDDAAARTQALALRVIADRLENGEAVSALMFSFSVV
jgi:predicted RNase H-like HicB family nuclease